MLIVALGESNTSRRQVQIRHNVDFRPGCSSTSTTAENIDAVKKMIFDNRRITVREVADDVSISFVSCQAIFMDILGIKLAAEKMVLNLINC